MASPKLQEQVVKIEGIKKIEPIFDFGLIAP
jgi:hypothetical protein